MNTEYQRAIADAVARISATTVALSGETPEELRRAIADRVADLGKPTNRAAVEVPAAEGSAAMRDVAAERRRQIEVEGWTPEHDDKHRSGGMAVAAACYALAGTMPDRPLGEILTKLWVWTGWAISWWKPKDRRHNLIRAGALILAEIERLDRAENKASRHAAAAPWLG